MTISTPDPGRGFVALPVEILDISMSPGAFRALVEFCRMADREGQCWPSLEQLGRRLGRSRSAVSGYVRELRELSLLATEEQRTANGYNYRLKYLVTFWKSWRTSLGGPPAPKAERRVQPVERPKRKNQIHENHSSRQGPRGDLHHLHEAWKRHVGHAPYPALETPPPLDLVDRSRLALDRCGPAISVDISDVLRQILKTRGLTADPAWLARIAPALDRMARAGLKPDVLKHRLAQAWKPHWTRLPSPRFMDELSRQIAEENPDAVLRKLLCGHLRRWEKSRDRLPCAA